MDSLQNFRRSGNPPDMTTGISFMQSESFDTVRRPIEFSDFSLLRRWNHPIGWRTLVGHSSRLGSFPNSNTLGLLAVNENFELSRHEDDDDRKQRTEKQDS